MYCVLCVLSITNITTIVNHYLIILHVTGG